MKINKRLKTGLVALAFLTLPTVSMATPSFSFNPTPVTGDVGDTIFVDLMWDGDGANYLGAYDFNIGWDDSIVSLSSVGFGSGVDSMGCSIGISCDNPQRLQVKKQTT